MHGEKCPLSVLQTGRHTRTSLFSLKNSSIKSLILLIPQFSYLIPINLSIYKRNKRFSIAAEITRRAKRFFLDAVRLSSAGFAG